MENQNNLNPKQIARQMTQIHNLMNKASRTEVEEQKLQGLQEKVTYAIRDNEQVLVESGWFAMTGKAKNKILTITEKGLEVGQAEIDAFRNAPTQKKRAQLDFERIIREQSDSAKMQLAAILLTDIFCADRQGVKEGQVPRLTKTLLFAAENSKETFLRKEGNPEQGFTKVMKPTAELFGADFEVRDFLEALDDATSTIDTEFEVGFYEEETIEL